MMGYKNIYKSNKVACGLHDLEIWLDEGVYGINIESMIEYEDVGSLKKYYLKLLNGCKEYLEQQYKLKSEDQGDCSLEYELYYNEKFKLFSIGFNPGEFLKLDELYLWICKVVNQVNCIG